MQAAAQEEFVGSNHDHHQALIMKGKRTKRQRSSSPFGLTVTSSSSSGGGGAAAAAEEYNSISSPVTTGDQIYDQSTEEEEEEDMANCLIMLAHSDGPKRRNITDKERFMEEMVTATNKGTGAYAYECKTCNRSFPSFQALGGHRASHKKPKGDEKKPLVLVSVEDPIVQDSDDQFNSQNPAVLALQVSNNNNNNKPNCHGNKLLGNKIHECSICGSEFSSGQALGGHMRRHRAAATATNNQASAVSVDTTTTTTSSSSPIIESRNGHGTKPRKFLSLDLNLPAPEDDLRDSKFQFVFSTPALVDCHY